MNINYKQSQFELFPHVADHTPKEFKHSYFFSSLTLSMENIIILSIFVIMLMVFAFSLGVERGKKVVLRTDPAVSAPEPVSQVPVTVEAKLVNSAPVALEAVEVPLRQPLVIAQKKPQPQAAQDGFTVQVASFKQEKYAQQEASALKKNGYKKYGVFVLAKGDYSIVCIGAFQKRREAEQLSIQLKKRYKDCLIRRL